jgi:hypothetical protein
MRVTEGSPRLPGQTAKLEREETYTTSRRHRESPICLWEDEPKDLIATSGYICRLDIMSRRDLPVVPLMTSYFGKKGSFHTGSQLLPFICGCGMIDGLAS